MKVLLFLLLFISYDKAEISNQKDLVSKEIVLNNYFRKVLPKYLIEYCIKYDIPLWYAFGVSHTESRHNPNAISHKSAFGRFQIKEIWLDNFLQIRRINKNKIKNVKKFLLNDKYNCYIWAYSVKIWRGLGYNYNQTSQIWLYGERGFLDGSYSKRYENNIFRYKIDG